jgi:hypothetical protein
VLTVTSFALIWNQKRYGVISYNKIKHGLLVVPSGRAYKPDVPDSPAALFLTPAERQKDGALPYTIYGFPSGDMQIEQRHASIEFVQCNLRLFAGLYVVARYPEALAARGISPQKLFDSKEFCTALDQRGHEEEVGKLERSCASWSRLSTRSSRSTDAVASSTAV